MSPRNRKTLARHEAGFSMIELLVVVIIIGILAAVAIPLFLNHRKKGVDGRLKADLRHAGTIAHDYATDNPDSTTAYASVHLTAAGRDYKKSDPAYRVEIKGNPKDGFCIRARSNNGSTSATEYYWYDSKNGGLVNAKGAAAPTGGACAVTGTFIQITPVVT